MSAKLLTIVLLAILIAAFIAMSLACAVRIGRRPSIPPADPFSKPFGDMPGFTAEQMLHHSRSADCNIECAPLRRSFINHPIPAAPSDGTRAAAASLIPSGLAAVRNFFRQHLEGRV